MNIAATGAQSKGLYKAAGIMALFIVLAGLLDAITSNMGVGAKENGAINTVEWLALFQKHPFSAFSSLGVINIVTLSLSIPVYMAFNQAHRQHYPTMTALASILFFIGVAVYMSSNTVFGVFAISRQYAGAPEAQKPMLEAAAGALLAQGADLTTGTFIGLFFTQTAGLLMTSLMLHGKIFGKWIGTAGLAGFSLTIIFFILAAFYPAHFTTAMLFAMPGGLVLMAYQIMLARRFFQLGQ